MGQVNSKKTYHNNTIQNTLIADIQELTKSLSEQYTIEFLDPNFCQKISLIYYDQLKKFRKQEIDQVQYMLGITNDNTETKKIACQNIVNHYVKRIRLISKIQASLLFCQDRIQALTIGPRCNGQPEIFQLEECQKLGGYWQETVLLPDDTLLENKPWYQQVHNMQYEYIRYLKKFRSILKQFADFDDYVNDERLDYFDIEVDKLITNMQKTSYERYRSILATKTYTAEEIREKRIREASMQENYAAKQSALRVSKGLPPLRL